MKVLFVCRHNRFRSKVGEALLKHLAKDTDIKVASAGVKLDLMFVAPAVKKVLKEFGVNDVDNEPRHITVALMNWADKIIVVADNVDVRDFPRVKTEVWKISDCSQNDEEGIRLRVGEIEKHVKEFLRKTVE